MAENDPILDAIQVQNYGNGTQSSPAADSYMVFVGKLALNIFLHTLITGFTVFIISLCFVDPVRLFTFHPIFMTVGFFFCTTNAIFALSKYNVVTFRFHHQSRIILHWVMQAASIIFMTIGFILIILAVNEHQKKEKNAAHFSTNHSIVGLTAYILMCISSLGGVATLYKHKFRHYFSAKTFKIAHSAFGILTYTMGIAALSLAVFTDWFQKYKWPSTAWTCFAVFIIVWAYAIMRPLTGIRTRLGF